MMEVIGYRVAAWIDEVKHRRLAVFEADIREQERQLLAPDPLRPRRAPVRT
jgi:hypothetical protein